MRMKNDINYWQEEVKGSGLGFRPFCRSDAQGGTGQRRGALRQGEQAHNLVSSFCQLDLWENRLRLFARRKRPYL